MIKRDFSYCLIILCFFYPLSLKAIIEVTEVVPITPGLCDGSVDITATGSAGPFTFLWSGPNGFMATSEDIANLCDPGLYTVEIFFASSSCTVTFTISIAECGYDIQAVETIYPVCAAGSNDGQINVIPFGGAPPYTYEWSNGATTQNIQNLSTGNYCVTITDGNGCKSDQKCFNVGIATPLSLSVTAYPPGPICNGGSGLLTSIPQGGKAPYILIWNNGSYGPQISVSSSGTYSVTVADACGATAAAFYSYSISPPIALDMVLSNICGGLTNIDLTVSGGTSPFSYLWHNGATTEDVMNIANYASVTVTDALGCTKTKSVFIPGLALNVNGLVTNSTFGNCSDGSISTYASGGTPPYTYSWTGPQGFTSNNSYIANLVKGKYCVTVTDASNCTQSSCLEVKANTEVYIGGVVSVKNCVNYGLPEGAVGGSIDLIKIGPANVTYHWSGPNGFSSSNMDISNLQPGSYNVTITNPSTGCTQTLYAFVGCCSSTGNINFPPPPPITEIQISSLIAPSGASHNGAINIEITGGGAAFFTNFYYYWTGPEGFYASTQNISGLLPGTYCVTVTDGCSSLTRCIELKTCESLNLTANIVHTCVGFTVGSITVNPYGGNPPYTYSWSTGSTSQTINNLNAGNYSITVTDKAGCTRVYQYLLIGTLTPSSSAMIDEDNCKKTLSCNGVSKTIDGYWISEYSDCNTYKLFCEIDGIKHLVDEGEQPIEDIFDPEGCYLICQGGLSSYSGTPLENEIQYNINTRECSFSDGCMFYNVYINGEFLPELYVPNGPVNNYTLYIQTVYNAPECVDEPAPNKCLQKYYCNNVLVETSPCKICPPAPPSFISGSTRSDISKFTSITLAEYLKMINEKFKIKNFAIDKDLDLNMRLEEYNDSFDKKDHFKLKVYNTEEIESAFKVTSLKNELIVYPNPFNSYLTINAMNIPDDQGVELHIYNIMGNTILSKTFTRDDNKENLIIETQNFAPGLYQIQITTSGETFLNSAVKISNN